MGLAVTTLYLQEVHLWIKPKGEGMKTNITTGGRHSHSQDCGVSWTWAGWATQASWWHRCHFLTYKIEDSMGTVFWGISKIESCRELSLVQPLLNQGLILLSSCACPTMGYAAGIWWVESRYGLNVLQGAGHPHNKELSVSKCQSYKISKMLLEYWHRAGSQNSYNF